MKKEIKEVWCRALRSGDYKQGRCKLRNHKDRFCCLGVLSDIAAKNGVIESPVLKQVDDSTRAYWYDGKYDHLSDKVMEWAGLTSDLGVYTSRQDSLANHNDAGMTFKEIADIIEKHF